MSQVDPPEEHTLSSLRALDHQQLRKLMLERYSYDGYQFQRDMRVGLENSRWYPAIHPNQEGERAGYRFQIFCTDPDGSARTIRVTVIKDDNAPLRTLDEIPPAIHEFGRACCKNGTTYLGFTTSHHHNAGPFFALAYHYRMMGRGWFPDGKNVPERCPHLVVGPYSFSPQERD